MPLHPKPKGWTNPCDRRTAWSCDSAFYFKPGPGGRPKRYRCKTCRHESDARHVASPAERHDPSCPWHAHYSRDVPHCPDCRARIYSLNDHHGWCDLVRQLLGYADLSPLEKELIAKYVPRAVIID